MAAVQHREVIEAVKSDLNHRQLNAGSKGITVQRCMSIEA